MAPQPQAPEERNYHMFYCMLAGITEEEKKTLNLGDATEYTFLNKVIKSRFFKDSFCHRNQNKLHIAYLQYAVKPCLNLLDVEMEGGLSK